MCLQIRRCGDLELCRPSVLACDLWFLLQFLLSLGFTTTGLWRCRVHVRLVLLRVYLLSMHFHAWHQEPWQIHKARIRFDRHGKSI